MSDGWIKLWRKSLDSGLLQNHELWAFWCWCLMKATHKPFRQMVGYQKIELEAGQFIFGRKAAAKELKLTERKVRTCLAVLENLENLTIKTTNKFSVITVKNWNTYQQDETANDQQNDQQVTSKRPTSDHQPTTNKNEKNKRTEEDRESLSACLSPSNFSQNGIPAREISEAWNEAVQKNASILSQVSKISADSTRYRHLKARWMEWPDMDVWLTVFDKATRSDFLNGRIKKFSASFDWLIKSKDNFVKTLEGNYCDKSQGQASGMTLEQFKDEFNMDITSTNDLEYWIGKGTIRADQRARFLQ